MENTPKKCVVRTHLITNKASFLSSQIYNYKLTIIILDCFYLLTRAHIKLKAHIQYFIFIFIAF